MDLPSFLSDIAFSSLLIFAGSFLFYGMCLIASQIIFGKVSKEGDDNLNMVLGAALSLLALLLGFSMSMAVNGYHDRQLSEQNEAISIKSAYLKTYRLNESKGEMRDLLRQYLGQRITFYTSQKSQTLRMESENKSAGLQDLMWSLAVNSADGRIIEQDIINIVSSGQKASATWQNQVPAATWILLIFVGAFCHILLGYSSRNMKGKKVLLFILPLMISLAFFIIAEIDIPGQGIIRVSPANLISLSSYL